MTDIRNVALERLREGELTVGIGLRQARTVDIAKAMKTALSDQKSVTGLTNIAEDFARDLVEDSSPEGHRQHQVVTRFARAVTAATRLTIVSAKTSGITIIDHGIERIIALNVDRPTVAAVATVGSTHGDGTLTTKADTARAAIAAFDVELALVDELGHPARLGPPPGAKP